MRRDVLHVVLATFLGMQGLLDVFGNSGSMKTLACVAKGLVPSDKRHPALTGASVDMFVSPLNSARHPAGDIQWAVSVAVDVSVTIRTVFSSTPYRNDGMGCYLK